jgi:asparagine synthase (glutamine-hydrolysing)
MCGILATINQEVSLMKTALNNMSHRGPDATGEFFHKNLGLGHLRLSIQDLSPSADQPMHTLDEQYSIVFNGEIYNHRELREKELKDYSFKTTSDTETLLALYIKHSEKCLGMLNGIFAFVIYDKVSESIFVARDQFGVKPLYYSLSDNKFACASELKALLPYLEDTNLDIESIQDYLTYMWCPGEGTPINEVSKLLPGSYLRIDINQISKVENVRYYKLKYPKKIKNDKPIDVWIEDLEEKLILAVKRQLLSDAPIGFFLSGGLDSSLLVAMARKILPDSRLKCYTIDTGESKDGFSNDLFYARKVAEHLDVDLIEIKVDSSLVDIFDKIIWFLDEPESDPAPFNAYKIAESARKDGIKVLIGGTGGDDIFSGYRRHQALLVDKYFDSIPMFLRKLIKKTVLSISSKKPFIRRLKKLTKSIDKNKSERIISYFEWQDFDFIKNVFTENIKNSLNKENKYFKILLEDVKDVESDLNKLLYLEIYTFLIDHNLNYTDKAGMGNSVEIRVPYLDIDLVEFSTTIPPNLKMKGKQTKYLLRKVAEKYLPRDVIYRPKAGFGAPIENWVRYDLDEYIAHNLSEEAITAAGVFDFKEVNNIIKLNKTGKINASYNVWSLLSVQSWLKQFHNK